MSTTYIAQTVQSVFSSAPERYRYDVAPRQYQALVLAGLARLRGDRLVISRRGLAYMRGDNVSRRGVR